MAICVEKKDAPLDIISLKVTFDQLHYSSIHRGSAQGATQPALIPSFKLNTPGGFTVGNPIMPMSKVTSKEQFVISQHPTPNTVASSCMLFTGPGQTVCSRYSISSLVILSVI